MYLRIILKSFLKKEFNQKGREAGLTRRGWDAL
jgi:hypothetical protein